MGGGGGGRVVPELLGKAGDVGEEGQRRLGEGEGEGGRVVICRSVARRAKDEGAGGSGRDKRSCHKKDVFCRKCGLGGSVGLLDWIDILISWEVGGRSGQKVGWWGP